MTTVNGQIIDPMTDDEKDATRKHALKWGKTPAEAEQLVADEEAYRADQRFTLAHATPYVPPVPYTAGS